MPATTAVVLDFVDVLEHGHAIQDAGNKGNGKGGKALQAGGVGSHRAPWVGDGRTKGHRYCPLGYRIWWRETVGGNSGPGGTAADARAVAGYRVVMLVEGVVRRCRTACTLLIL